MHHHAIFIIHQEPRLTWPRHFYGQRTMGALFSTIVQLLSALVVMSVGANQNVYKVWFFPKLNSNQVEIQRTAVRMLPEASAPNPPFNAQSQTSYPSCPSLKNPPRHSVVGGYVINNATCVAWGSRITKTPLDPEVRNDSIAAFCAIMRKLEAKPYHTFFTMFGPESYKQYMVVTQSAPFRGWRGMD